MALPLSLVSYITLNLPSGLIPNEDLVETLVIKWQNTLYVAFGIGEANKNLEASYSDLQNIFIGDLVSYDLIIIFLNSKIAGMSASGSSTDGATGGLKRVQTGPAEVEYFSLKESAEALASTIKDGGVIEELKSRICGQADFLQVKVYICKDPKITKVPIIFKP